MKPYICSLICIITGAYSIAMNFPETKKLLTPSPTQQQNERIASISETINKSIENISLCCGVCTKSFSKQDHLDLLKFVDSCYQEKEMHEHDIDKLKKKNSFFAATIDYFCGIAKKNYAAVTLSTLNIITDYKQPQPTKKLNKLSPALKKYVMTMAYNKIRRVHSIEFIGHTARVRHVAINQEKYLACSASKDGTFRLWDLQTGKNVGKLKEKAVSGYVVFNHTGTLLATATLSQEQPFEITIKIWDPCTKRKLWTIQHHNQFSALAFFQGSTDTTLAILGQNYSTLYTLKKDLEPMRIGTSLQSIPITVDKGYKIKKKEDHAWIAEKSAPALYLCERAIENSTVPTLFSMQNTPLYTKLLETEKEIVNALFSEKFLITYTRIN